MALIFRGCCSGFGESSFKGQLIPPTPSSESMELESIFRCTSFPLLYREQLLPRFLPFGIVLKTLQNSSMNLP